MKWFIVLWMVFATFCVADEHDKHHLSKDLSYLQLSTEQQNSVKQVIKAYRHELKAFRESKEATEKQKAKRFSDDVLDEAAMVQLRQTFSAKAAVIETRFLMQMHAILTPAQRELFARNLEEWEVE